MKRLRYSIFLTVLAALSLPGCVTPKKEPTTIVTEDDETESRRRVYGNWWRPSVSEEDKAFFYRPFWNLK